MNLQVDERVGSSGIGVLGPHPVWGSREISGDLAGYLEAAAAIPDSAQLVQNMRGTALVNAYAKMNQASMSGLETLKDLDATVRMLRRPFQGSVELLTRMAKSRKKNLGKSATSIAKATANAWLEHRYGWKPLLMDIDTIVQYAHVARAKCDGRRLVSRSGVDRDWNEFQKVTLQSSGKPFPPGVSTVVGTQQMTKSVRVGAGVFYDLVSQSTADSLLKLLGVRPNDLPVGVWECIPYSFVVDWFVNVSGWLNAVTPNPWIVVRGNWVTTVTEFTVVTDNVTAGITVANPPVTTYSVAFPGSVRKYSRVDRYVNQLMPSTPLQTLKPLSAIHSVDGLALMTGQIMNQIFAFKPGHAIRY
jgi:hypothetical protein